MSNYDYGNYTIENMSPNPNIQGINPNIQGINPNISETINPNNIVGLPTPIWEGQPNYSYCSPTGSSYCQLVNPEDLFNNNKSKSAIEIKSIRDCILDILNKKSSFDDEEYNDVNFKDEKIDELIEDINKYLNKFNTLQEEIYKIEKELKEEITTIKMNIDKLNGIIEFLLKLGLIDDKEDNKEDDEDMEIMVENIKKVSKRISKTEKFNEIKKKYVAKRKELNKYIYLLTNLNKLNISNRCPICLDKTIDHYLDPCGHTMCKTCIEKSMRVQMNNSSNNTNY